MMATEQRTRIVTGTVADLTSIEAALVELRKVPEGILGDAAGGMTVTLIVSLGAGGSGSGTANGSVRGTANGSVRGTANGTVQLREVRQWAAGFRYVTLGALRKRFDLDDKEGRAIGETLIVEGVFAKPVRKFGFPIIGAKADAPIARGEPRPRPGRRPKRDQKAMDAARETLRAAIVEHPGLKMGELLQLPTLARQDLILPMRQLIAEAVVYTEGNRRGMSYWPAGGAKGKGKPPLAVKATKVKAKATKAKAKVVAVVAAKPAKPTKPSPKKTAATKPKKPATVAKKSAPPKPPKPDMVEPPAL